MGAKLLTLVLAGAAIAAPAGAVLARAAASPSINDRMTGDIVPVHDPAIIKQGDTYYLFTTSQEAEKNGLIHVRASKDLVTWTRLSPVFQEMPGWAREAIPKTVGIWAPDIAFVNGEYRLYYSISTFGSNRSVIGLVTAKTLDPASPEHGWTDKGEVVSSDKWDKYNAIDGNLVVDREGRHWLSFGSFWSGIKMVRIDPATGKRSSEDGKVYALAERPRPGAVEAPFIIERGGYYYLFASYDFCCRGKDSSYYTVVGRSEEITGPYEDYDGKSLMRGGGQIVLHAQLDKTGRWKGPGHPAILRDEGRDYIVYHSYDAEKDGAPTLRIAPLGWTADGWPVAKP